MTATLVEGLLEVTERAPHRTALSDSRGTTSFAALAASAGAVAAALKARGLAGTRIGLAGRADRDWVIGFFGVLGCGGTAVPLSPLYPLVELERLASTGRVAAVLAGNAAPGLPAVKELSLREIASGRGAALSAPSGGDAVLLFTSGTTGAPKGALLSHANLASLAEVLRSAWQLGPEDALAHALPLHHLHGLGIALLPMLLAGGTVELLDGFVSGETWNAFARATLFMGVPTMHRKLLDAFDAAERSERATWERLARGLRLVTSGSAALPASLGERWRSVHGSYPLERFGMTEIGVGTSNPLRGERRPGSCGTPLGPMQVRIVGEGGRDVEPGEPGEIWFRGPSVFSGYDAAPEATRAAFAGDWFKSGDTAEWLSGGYVRVLGRTSVDIIKSGGYKLSALEIEDALRGHPAVNEVAVVGVPDETWGEAAIAAVVLGPASAGTHPDEIRAWLKQRIAPYKVPRRVVIVGGLPHNALGKVQKPELARRLAGA